MIHYHIPQGVQASQVHGRPVLSTPEGGQVAVDSAILALWRQAGGRSLEQVLANFGEAPDQPQATRAALACLAEAGLLAREEEAAIQQSAASPATAEVPRPNGGLVSAVIVSYNSRTWLETCLPSLEGQTYAPIETIIVDNASSDDTMAWVSQYYPQARLTRCDDLLPFAAAVNRGVELAQGETFLILNPDITLTPDAVAHLVTALQSSPNCAAAAAKLKFTWAPAFLNGLGNRVGAFSWGSDNALGHLDLGQLDGWQDLPSACFAATLVSRAAWKNAGPADEKFPMYYEDTEWAYRARLLGYTVCAAPSAVIYHAFSSRVPSGENSGLAPLKLHRVTYGRLRFAAKLLGPAALARYLISYSLEDGARCALALLRGRRQTLEATVSAWNRFLRDLPELRRERQALQARRAIEDGQLFVPDRRMPAPLMWRGLPQLTWDGVLSQYAPLLLARQTRPVPEFPGREAEPPLAEFLDAKRPLARLRQIWRMEGFSGFLHHLWRLAQWRLSLP